MERFAIKIDERVKLNLYNICRLCGIDNRDQVPIVEGPDTTFVIDDEPSLCKKIVDCVGIQVVITDRMPQKICILCVDKINDFYEYREMCKATNLQTRELLGLPPEVKDEKPPVELVPKPKRQQPFVEIPAENIKRKRKLKSECISYEELDDDEIDEKPPKKKIPKNSVGSKSKKHLPAGRILVKRESVKPLPSRVLPTREKAIPASREKPATLIKEKLTTPPIKEKTLTLRDKSTTVKEKNLIVKEKQTTMKEKVVPHPVKEKAHLTKEKLPTKEKHTPPIKEKTPLVKEKTQIVKEKAQLEKVKLKPVKEKPMSFNTKSPILKEKSNKEKTTMKEKLIPLVEQKFEPASSKMDSELITLKTPNRRERQRELETKKKRKVQTLQPVDKVKTENLHPCIVCPKDFKTQPEYDIHFFREHTPNTLEHGCSACREAFYDLQEYRDHQLWHRLSSIPFSCFKCDSNFDRVTAYTRHFLTSCVPQNEYILVDDIKCQKCQKIFVTKNLYEWHGCLIKNNSKCPRCNKFFAKRLNLQRHVVICNDKMVEAQPVVSVARNKRSEAVEAESCTTVTSNDGKKTVKIEPGSIIEIENESRDAVPNSNDGEDHEMEDSVEDDVGFQDDHEEIEEETGVIANPEIDNSANLDKDNSDVILILDDDESTTIAPVKQEKVDRRYDEVICRASTANIPMVQIKQEIFSTDYVDQVNFNILRNIKPEPIESAPEPVQGASKPNTSKNVCSATVPECPNQATKLAAAKPTLKLKIKKEHGTLNSSFIESDLGEGDSSPNPNRSNDDELGTSSYYRKRRNKHKKKIYKIPKQLALIIKQEKQTRDNYEKDTSIAEEDADSMITVPVISEVTSIADTAIEPGNTLNQSEYFEEEEANPAMSICYPGQFREVTEDIGIPVESQNVVQMPVIAEVVSLKQPEPRLPLISSVTSLSQTSGIRVKMEFSNFASPRPDSFETQTLPDNNRIEQDDMITGNYHMEYDTVENPDDHLANTDSEEIGLSTSKDSIESDFEEKPNLEELIEMSDITKKIQNSTEVVLEEVRSPEFVTSHLTGIVIPTNKLTESISINKLSEISANILEKNEILSEQENQPNNANGLENFKNVSTDENISANLADQNYIETNENVKNNTEEIRLVAEEMITTKCQETLFTESPLEISPANVKDQIDEENEGYVTNVTEVSLEQGLQPIAEDSKLTKDTFSTELTIDVNKTDQTDVTHHESILESNLETDKPDISVNIAQENATPESAINIGENVDYDESNLINSTHENNEKIIPVSRRTSDWCDTATINESTEILDNEQKINIQPETINKPDLEENCNKTTSLNIKIEQATSSSSNENKPTELVINTHVEARKRQLEIYENLEESSPKIQKIADIYLDNDIRLEDSKFEPLELHINQRIDAINQPTRVNAITKSEDILLETENEEAKIKLHCNPVPNEEELEGDRQFDTTSPSEEDIHSNPTASNILDLQNENLNVIEIIKAEVFEDQTSEHDKDSVIFVSEYKTSTMREQNFDLGNQKDETVVGDNLVLSSNLTETNEDQKLEITKGENSKFLSANLEEAEHMNLVDESTRDQAITILEERDSTIVSQNFDMQIDEDERETIKRDSLESIRSDKSNTSTTNKEANEANLEEEFKIVSENVGLNEDIQRDETKFSQNVEDNLIEIDQGSNFSVPNEELSITSDHQHFKLDSSTNVVKEMSCTFENENDSNMENEDSNIIHSEVEQIPSQDKDLSKESNDGSSNSGLLEDSSNKIRQKTEIDRDIDELTLDEVVVEEYPQYDEFSNRGYSPIVSEVKTVEVEHSSSEMQLEYSINVEDEESTTSQIIPVHSEPNMEGVISTKNENETDNLVLQSDECVSPNIEQFNSNLNEVYVKYPSDVRIQSALENDLDEISDESMNENILDAPLKEEPMGLTKSIEPHCVGRAEHLITDTLENDSSLVDLKSPEEQIYEIHSDSSSENINTFENKLTETLSKSTKQAEEITSSEISSSDSLGFSSSESSLDSSSDDSTSASSSIIEIETKGNLDFEQILSSSKEASQTQVNEVIKSNNTTESLLIENADVFVQINENAIVETSLHFQNNDNETVTEISSSSSDVILEENVETVPENIHSILEQNVETVPENIPSISSNVVQKASSHKNLNHNLDNTTNLSINVLQTNQDGIIYKTIEIEEDIDSDLEKELLEEGMHDEEPDK